MIQPIAVPALSDNYIWLLRREGSNACVVVDPGEAEATLDALSREQLEPGAVLITHRHGDHVGGLGDVRARFPDIPVYGPASESIEGVSHGVADGDRVDLPDLDTSFDVIATPGHTRGHIVFHGSGLLLSGDTLFAGGCGRVFEGTNQQMADSLARLAGLPDDTVGCCGHEYTLANLAFAQAVEPANEAIEARLEAVRRLRDADQPSVPFTLAEERRTNPFLRCEEPEVRAAAVQRAGRELIDSSDVFGVLRDWKNNS